MLCPPPRDPLHLSPNLPVYPPNILLGESLRLGPQHGRNLRLAHADLVPDRHQAGGEMHIILAQQRDRHHDVVDVLEDERAAVAVLGFGF